MIINNQPNTLPAAVPDSAAQQKNHQMNTKAVSNGAANPLEFTSPSSNLPTANAPSTTPISTNTLLDSLQQLISTLASALGLAGNTSSAPSPNMKAAAPQSTTENESVASDGASYADGLNELEYSNMLSGSELSTIVRQTPGLTRTSNNELQYRPATVSEKRNNESQEDFAARRNRTNDTNTRALETSLQAAADSGVKLNIDGNITIREPILIRPTADLNVDATGAIFRATGGLDGDMIRIQASTAPVDGEISIDWDGGFFDISAADNAAAASPHINEFTDSSDSSAAANAARARRGSAQTTDGLSIIGTDRGTGQQRIHDANINNVRITGLPVDNLTAGNFNSLTPSDPARTSWREAGGDSGIFIQGLDEANVTNSEFYGIRDAGVYFSASPPGTAAGQFGGDYTATGNTITNAFDGLSSKRGADNINFSDNTLTDVVIGLSIKETVAGTQANNITIDDNTITRTARGILLEDAVNATITNNTISELGQNVAGEGVVRNSSDNRLFEGIALESVSGNINIDDNTINRSNSGSNNNSGIVGVVRRTFDSKDSRDPSSTRLNESEVIGDNRFNGFSGDTGNRVRP